MLKVYLTKLYQVFSLAQFSACSVNNFEKISQKKTLLGPAYRVVDILLDITEGGNC
jgi:hypothetical protein